SPSTPLHHSTARASRLMTRRPCDGALCRHPDGATLPKIAVGDDMAGEFAGPRFAFAIAAALVLAPFSTSAHADSCSDLASVTLKGAPITAATGIPAGEFTTPAQLGYGSVTIDVPAFCRVQLIIGTATAEVWLPEAWNGRLTGWGNGGELGAIIYLELW